MSPVAFLVALTTHGIPAPPEAPIEGRWVARHDDWYVRTETGWLWWDPRSRVWKPTTYGP